MSPTKVLSERRSHTTSTKAAPHANAESDNPSRLNGRKTSRNTQTSNPCSAPWLRVVVRKITASIGYGRMASTPSFSAVATVWVRRRLIVTTSQPVAWSKRPQLRHHVLLPRKRCTSAHPCKDQFFGARPVGDGIDVHPGAVLD